MATCSIDETIKIWDLDNFECIKIIENDRMLFEIQTIVRLKKSITEESEASEESEESDNDLDESDIKSENSKLQQYC